MPQLPGMSHSKVVCVTHGLFMDRLIKANCSELPRRFVDGTGTFSSAETCGVCRKKASGILTLTSKSSPLDLTIFAHTSTGFL